MKTDFWNYSDDQKLSVFDELREERQISPKAVEKDWWVSHVLLAIFNLQCADALTFKGGTSLSKAWGVTRRFSEDIDISIDKSFFGLEGVNPSQRDRIRKLSRKYISEKLFPELNATLRVYGALECELTYKSRTDSDADPTVLFVHYNSLLPEEEYIKGVVKVEFSCRNLREPREMRRIVPMVCEFSPVIESPDIVIPTVVPTRTFLEKMFLLHEEFQKEYPRHKRMSRHLYDIIKLDEAGYVDAALSDKDLYDSIVEHRKTFNAVRGIDYSCHIREKIRFIPPEEYVDLWKEDYEMMRGSLSTGIPLRGKNLSKDWKRYR